MKIITYGNPMLRKKAKSVDRITKEIKEVAYEMLHLMRTGETRGVGLAAPQVGISSRIFVIEPEPEVVYFFANPDILRLGDTETESEGCLSIPGLYAKIKRTRHIELRAINILTGKKITLDAKGFAARVIQHENDHLDGILFTDYIEQWDDFEITNLSKVPTPLKGRFNK